LLTTTFMGERRSTHQLIYMKEKIINKCLDKKMKWKEGAELLGMHPKALSRLKKNYLEHGKCVLLGKKPGPKKGWHASNRTPEEVEEIVERVAIENPHLGPDPLADELEKYRIYLDQSTVWRILKRRKVRYTHAYKRWKQDPKLYVLDDPGEEIQMDAYFPYGRARKIAVFDAIDDCSRFVFGEVYERETADNAIKFMTKVVERAPFQVKRVRVDNGYGKRFRKYCEDVLGIEVIENDPYEPKQNGKVERFHGTAKKHFWYRYCLFEDPLETLDYKYSSWIKYYNYNHKHTGLGMNKLTPVQKIITCYLMLLANRLLENKKVTLSLQQNKI
jgi:transposase InsO family protein